MKKLFTYTLFILLVIFAVFFLHSLVYHADSFISVCEDLFEPYLSVLAIEERNIFDSNGHNSFLYTILYCLFEVYVPKILNMHPLLCFEKITSYIYSFIFLLFLFFSAQCFSKYFTKYKIFISLILSLFLFPLFVLFLNLSDLWYIFYIRSWMCVYFIQPLLLIILFQIIFSNYFHDNKYSKSKIFIIFILLFLVAGTYEIFKYIVLAFLVLISCLYFSKTDEKSCRKQYLLFLSGYIVFNIILFCLYKHHDYVNFINFNSSIDTLISYFKGFFSAYYNYLIYANSITLGLIIATLISILFLVNDSSLKKKFFSFIVCLFIAVMSYPLMTILFDFNPEGWVYTSYFHYACDHTGTRLVISWFLICILLSCLGFLYANLKTNKQKIITSLIIFILMIPVSFFIASKYEHWHKVIYKNTRKSYFIDQRVNLYILEKFYELFGHKNGVLYTYSPHNVVYYDHIIKYLYYLYSYDGNSKNIEDDIKKIKIIHVCGDEDDLFTVCREKMLNTVKNKVGYEFSEEELERTDFGSIKQNSSK